MRKKTTSGGDQLRSQYNVRTIRVAARSDRTALSANDSHEGNTPLGEVRVKVKLTNGVDEALVRRGLLTADKIRSYEADALVDTGAVRSVLPIHVVQLLGLAIVDKAREYANDAAEDVDVTEMVGITLLGRRITEETLVLGSEVLIGQTVLESLDLQVDCTNHCVIPNPAHPDQPMIKVKSNRSELRQTPQELSPNRTQNYFL
jgi:predicted aspartyl protease